MNAPIRRCGRFSPAGKGARRRPEGPINGRLAWKRRRDEVSQRANPKIIGAFVLGAVALVVVGVLLLGGTQFLTQKRTFVAYFEGSVKGLNIGAPVEFQGVRVGSVIDIELQFL